MSKYKTSNGINIFVKILTAIIVVLLVLGIVGGVAADNLRKEKR